MNKMKIEGLSFFNDRRKPFFPIRIENLLLQQITNFAYEMCFGEGHHRHHRTGGQLYRRRGEQFCNTFQGKMAEVVLQKTFIENGLTCNNPDFDVFGEGKWDDTDLIVLDKTISVKSAAHFSNLLLLESKDYDKDGNYLPNKLLGATSSYDFYVLVRIAPDIKSLFRKNRLMYSDYIDRCTIDSIINEQSWSYDIAGWISHSEFVNIIKEKIIIPQNALLNGKIKMDAENYYVQSGDMHDFSELCKILK